MTQVTVACDILLVHNVCSWDGVSMTGISQKALNAFIYFILFFSKIEDMGFT
jgi:hypothetical protein